MAESNLSQVSDLDEIVQLIDENYSSKNYEVVASLIEDNPAEAWYGIQPSQFIEIIGTVIDAGADQNGVLQGMYSLIAPASAQDSQLQKIDPNISDKAAPPETMLLFGESLALRLSGRADLALQSLDELDKRPSTVQPFFNTNTALELMISVQSGITAMLAGEFRRALVYFTQAQLHVAVPTLKLLNRDAYVKAALVQVLFDDAEKARISLKHAASIPRTCSWAEALIDANVTWVEAALEKDPDRAIETFLNVPLSDIGELWPYYALILHQVLSRSARWKELDERLTTLEKVPFPKVDGEGFTGSVFSIIRAVMSRSNDDEKEVRWHLKNVDQSILLSRIFMAQMEFDAGRYKSAVTITRGLAEKVNGLRRLEVWRYAILVESYLKLENTAAAIECLNAVLELSGSIREDDLQFFSLDAHDFAREHVEGWFLGDVSDVARQPGNRSNSSTQLTDREREILRYLAKGESRQEIADQLYISVNTLKSHLRKIYTKFEVSSRDEAVIRAEREGLL
ncbi:MAG TPA: response regulator transcription factor [Microbacteriaceae bacterium]|nr:response regulator transcription factor [Microbacteriaceae bacterium]